MIRFTRGLVATFTMLLILGACAQSRKSSSGAISELWQPQALCTNADGLKVLGCFSIQLDISNNKAFVDVTDIGDLNPDQYPYRVLGHLPSGEWHVLADNVRTRTGGTFEAHAGKNAYIEGYDHWIVELSVNRDSSGYNFVSVEAGKGLPMAQAIMDWPELYDQPTTQK